MKKLFLSLVAAMMCATATFAQKDRVATLTHEGTVKTFYGTDALREALEAADDGDVISLSSGVFHIERISKGVTILGAGMQDDEEQNVEKTWIRGISSTGYQCKIGVNISEDAEHPLNFKNVQVGDDYHKLQLYSDLRDATFTKCFIEGGIDEENAVCKNVNFVQCSCKYINHKQDSEANYLNCYIEAHSGFQIRTGSSISFMNCTLIGDCFYNFNNSTFLNCVLYETSTSSTSDDRLNTSNTVDNCLGYHHHTEKTVWDNGKSCKVIHTDIFKEGTFYELTDEAKALISSTDGTEIGMYGGQYPYNPIPDGPRITKFNVATKSSADNKLSVDVEVSSAE